jgi:inorganic pyrophosphatase
MHSRYGDPTACVSGRLRLTIRDGNRASDVIMRLRALFMFRLPRQPHGLPVCVYSTRTSRYRPSMDVSKIPAFADEDFFHVVVEAPRGSALKLKYEPRWQVMTISRPLPLGVTFPFDWGFVPSTVAADGDPLDAMLLWDVASYPGVVVECRAIGVLQVDQNRARADPSVRIRNDRVLAIPREARRETGVTDVADLPERVRQELEHFTIAATALEGKDARVIGWGAARDGLNLVRDSALKAGSGGAG